MDEVTICNMGMAHIKAGSISSLTQRTTEGIYCNLFYEPALEATLEALDWGFARKRHLLTLSSEDPPENWSYAYAYPSDCLKARRIQHPERNPRFPYPFEVSLNNAGDERIIYCDVANAKLVYTKRIDNPRLFSSAFAIAMSYKVAELTAMPVTGKGQIKQLMTQMFMQKISEAQADDMNEAEPDEEAESAFVKART